MLASPFHIIAHRGASGYAPENTMASFRRAVDLGATEVETDVAFTRDGELLLFHDETLERTTNGNGLPEDHTLAQLLGLDAGSRHSPRSVLPARRFRFRPAGCPFRPWKRGECGLILPQCRRICDSLHSPPSSHPLRTWPVHAADRCRRGVGRLFQLLPLHQSTAQCQVLESSSPMMIPWSARRSRVFSAGSETSLSV